MLQNITSKGNVAYYDRAISAGNVAYLHVVLLQIDKWNGEQEEMYVGDKYATTNNNSIMNI